MEKHRKKLIKNAAVFDGHSSGLAQGKKIVIEDDIVTEITACLLYTSDAADE